MSTSTIQHNSAEISAVWVLTHCWLLDMQKTQDLVSLRWSFMSVKYSADWSGPWHNTVTQNTCESEILRWLGTAWNNGSERDQSSHHHSEAVPGRLCWEMRIIEAFQAQLCSCFFCTILMKEAIEHYYCHANDLHVVPQPKYSVWSLYSIWTRCNSFAFKWSGLNRVVRIMDSSQDKWDPGKGKINPCNPISVYNNYKGKKIHLSLHACFRKYRIDSVYQVCKKIRFLSWRTSQYKFILYLHMNMRIRISMTVYV